MCFEPRSNSASYKLTFHTSKKLIHNSATITIFLKGVKFKFKWPREKKFHKKRRYTCNAGDLGSIPGLGRSPREGKGFPLQYSGLENSTGSHSVGHDWATFISQSSTEVTGHKSTGNSERRTRFADLESDLAQSQVAGNKPKGLMIQYFCLKATVVLLNNYFLPSWNIRVYTVPRSRLPFKQLSSTAWSFWVSHGLKFTSTESMDWLTYVTLILQHNGWIFSEPEHFLFQS